MARFSTLSIFAILPAIVSIASAQTFTACNPLNRTDCPTDVALGMSQNFNFTESNADPAIWNTTAGTVNYGSGGAAFTVSQKGDSPTIQSNFYIFFGAVEVIMKGAPGRGIISSIVLESDDLDEIDWEYIGDNNTHIETNYFGKGNTTAYDRAIYYPVNKPQQDFHNYTVEWTREKIDWIIDGKVVRTLAYKDANGGKNFPQTPMFVRIGIWAGGDSSLNNYTIDWAGGLTDYSKGPYTMVVASARISDYSTGAAYQYGDTSGSFQSIKITDKAKSAIAQNLSTLPPPTMAQRWSGLSSGAKIGIIAGSAAVLALLLGLLAFCCIKQRRAGRRQRAIDDANYEKGRAELMAYRAEMGQGGRGRWNGNGQGF